MRKKETLKKIDMKSIRRQPRQYFLGLNTLEITFTIKNPSIQFGKLREVA